METLIIFISIQLLPELKLQVKSDLRFIFLIYRKVLTFKFGFLISVTNKLDKKNLKTCFLVKSKREAMSGQDLHFITVKYQIRYLGDCMQWAFVV